MMFQPASSSELADALRAASADGSPVPGFDLGALNQVLEYTPEDMTVTVEAGITLSVLQAGLARQGQWLPVDPPHPDQLPVGALLAANGSGPRRYGCGTIRDWMIGIKVALADGRIIKSGGKVVKNVAGYDLGKVFIGSRGSLGLIVEATFKLRPLPETERFVQTRCASLTKAGELIDAVIGSEMTPVVLDLRRLSTLDSRLSPVLVLGFAGTREEVEWQIEQARGLGLGEAANLDYETEFWSAQPKPQCLSVLPSALVEAIGRLGNVPFVARAGNGVIYYRGGPTPPKNNLPLKLMQRLKDEFDPRHILPDLPL